MTGAATSGLTFFLDRGLGSRIVVGGLRDAGWALETMDERYGKDLSQRVSDQRWIAEATAHGDVLLCKDVAIAGNPLEAEAIYMSAARAFALARADITGPEMLRYFLDNEHAIVTMARRAAGPYVVAVSNVGLRRKRLAYP